MVEFARMDAASLLEETEKAVSLSLVDYIESVFAISCACVYIHVYF